MRLWRGFWLWSWWDQISNKTLHSGHFIRSENEGHIVCCYCRHLWSTWKIKDRCHCDQSQVPEEAERPRTETSKLLESKLLEPKWVRTWAKMATEHCPKYATLPRYATLSQIWNIAPVCHNAPKAPYGLVWLKSQLLSGLFGGPWRWQLFAGNCFLANNCHGPAWFSLVRLVLVWLKNCFPNFYCLVWLKELFFSMT